MIENNANGNFSENRNKRNFPTTPDYFTYFSCAVRVWTDAISNVDRVIRELGVGYGAEKTARGGP